MVRCKFVVKSSSVLGEGSGGPLCLLLRASAVTADSEENKTFWLATPSGDLTLVITNPDTFGAFQIGDEFYLDMTKISV